jgi:hypothetical protein
MYKIFEKCIRIIKKPRREKNDHPGEMKREKEIVVNFSIHSHYNVDRSTFITNSSDCVLF